MLHGASSPSTGTVKSSIKAGFSSGSTSAQFGISSDHGPNSNPFSFIAAKFAPLIQIRSIDPPVVWPAAFSLTTVLTAVAVSDSFTCSSVTPKLSFTC